MAITDLPSYWQDEINASVRTIKSNVNTIRTNAPALTPRTSTFFFITDVHWRGNSKKSPQIALEVANAVDADDSIPTVFKTRPTVSDYRRVVFAGDAIKDHAVDKEAAIKELNDTGDTGGVKGFYPSWDSSFHIATALGNHDNNGNGNSDSSKIFSSDEMYDQYLAREENYVSRNTSTAKDTTISWFDDTVNKVRYYMFRHYTNSDMSDAVQTKFINSITNETTGIENSGWGAIFFCHAFWGITQDETNPGHRKILSNSIPFASKLTDICCSYRVTPIALMVGHIHGDDSFLLTTNSGNKLLVTATVCDTHVNESTNVVGTPVMTPNTATEQAFEFVQIDMNSNKLYLTRVGAGSDRLFNIPVPLFVQYPILFIGAGTSSMQGYTEETESGDISVENAWYWDYYNNEWKTPVCDPTGVNNHRGSIAPAFLSKIRQMYPLRPLLFVNAGKGGSTISSDLVSDADGNWSIEGNLIERLNDMVRDATSAWHNPNIAYGGILWYGGGNDRGAISSGTTSLATYKTSFRDTLLSLHSTYGSNFYLIGLCGSPSLTEEQRAVIDDIRQAQEEVIEEFTWANKVADAITYEADSSNELDPNLQYWTGYTGSHLGQAAIDALGVMAATNILHYGYLGEAMSLKFINLQNLNDFWDNAKAWVNAKDYANHTELAAVNNNAVHLTGDQTIAGNKTFTDGITANVTGTSERATKDANGNVIDTTYATKDEATISAKGLMSAADKAKLDGIASALTFKGSVVDDTSFPASDNVAGDTYLNEDDGHLYAYDGTDWTDLGLIAFTSMTNAEVDAVFEE